MSTTSPQTNSSKTKAGRTKERWLLYDARQYILGRLAAEISNKLRDKDLASYDPSRIGNTHVVVINAQDINFTGQKEKTKQYYRHSRYPGGLKVETLGALLETKPTAAIRRAVQGMLPKNRLQNKRIKRLHIYAGAEHQHSAQNPQVINPK